MENFTLECCVDSVQSAIAAEKGGATRLELCSNLIIGGTSPSPSLFNQIKKYVNLPIRVLLRPRFGDFYYTNYEIDVLNDEINTFKNLGADGIVIGCLNPDGDLDIKSMEKFIYTAGDLVITLHRAIDVCSNPMKALEQAKKLGISTILTSGAKNNAYEGKELIKQLCANAENIEILAGAGINVNSIKLLLDEIPKLKSFHMSGKSILQSKMKYKNKDVFMGLENISEYQIWQTDINKIKMARAVLENKR